MNSTFLLKLTQKSSWSMWPYLQGKYQLREEISIKIRKLYTNKLHPRQYLKRVIFWPKKNQGKWSEHKLWEIASTSMHAPAEPAERFRAAETSCLIDLCSSSCMSMQASSILCMLFILCCSLAMSILKSLMMSQSCTKWKNML